MKNINYPFSETILRKIGMKKCISIFYISNNIIKIKPIPLLVIVLLTAFCSSCAKMSNLLPDYQLLSDELPQSFKFQESADLLWALIFKNINHSLTSKIITLDKKERLITWCESAENWKDLGHESISPPDTPFPRANFYKKYIENLGKGIRFSTVWIEDLENGCNVHIRCVYYKAESFAGFGHSRGDYEIKLINNIQKSL